MLLNSAQVNAVTMAPVGGIAGFLAGWIWQTRSGTSEK
jgi:hypothetical protein